LFDHNGEEVVEWGAKWGAFPATSAIGLVESPEVDGVALNTEMLQRVGTGS